MTSSYSTTKRTGAAADVGAELLQHCCNFALLVTTKWHIYYLVTGEVEHLIATCCRFPFTELGKAQDIQTTPCS